MSESDLNIDREFDEWFNMAGHHRYPLNAYRAGYKSALQSAQEEIDRLKAGLSDAREIINDIDSWAKAYPEKVFPEPEPEAVKAVCNELGITLDSLSAMVLRGFVKSWGDKASLFLSKYKANQ